MRPLLVLSHGIDTGRAEWFSLYRSIALADIIQVDLENVPASHLANWLGYIVELLSKEDIAKLDFLPKLMTHGDQRVRHEALVLAAHGHHLSALTIFAASPYAAPPNGEDKLDPRHEYWRNRALLELCAFVPDASLSECLNPESVALIAEQRPTDTDVLEQFNTYLRGEFEAIREAKPWSSSRYWGSHRKAVDALVAYDPDSVLAWLTPWLENPGNIFDKALMNPFPVIDTMQALGGKIQDVALDLYDTLIDPPQRGPFSSDGIARFPFEVPVSKRATDLCDRLLEEATTDKALLEVVCSAHRHQRLDWLFAWIERLETSPRPAAVAKSYTLLGFCDESDRADTHWKAFLARPPLDDWLCYVFKKSASDYARSRVARRALTRFWSDESPSVARYALKRVEETCDMRILNWTEAIRPEWKDHPRERRLAFDLATTSLNQAVKRDKERRKKELFHTRQAYSTMAPWK